MQDKKSKAKGIHGGNRYIRGDGQARGINVKAQQRLKRRLADFIKSPPHRVIGPKAPGSMKK